MAPQRKTTAMSVTRVSRECAPSYVVMSLALTAVLTFSDCTPTVRAESFHSADYHYTIEIPQEWMPVPQEVLNDVLRMTGQQPERSPMVFDAVFQDPSTEAWLTPPYVMIQVLPFARMGLNRQPREDEIPQIVRGITASNVRQTAKKTVTEPLQDMVNTAAFSNQQIDLKNQRFSYETDMTVPGFGEVHGDAIAFVGRTAMVQVILYSRPNDRSEVAPIRESLVRSFHFDPDAAYDESQMGHRSVSVQSARLIAFIGFGVFICLAGSAIAYFVLRSRRPATPVKKTVAAKRRLPPPLE